MTERVVVGGNPNLAPHEQSKPFSKFKTLVNR